MKKQITAVLLSVVIGAMALAGCGEDVRTDNSSDRLTEEEAKALFRHYWIFYFGVGALCATGRYTFTDEELEGMMEQDLRSMSACASIISPAAIEDDQHKSDFGYLLGRSLGGGYAGGH